MDAVRFVAAHTECVFDLRVQQSEGRGGEGGGGRAGRGLTHDAKSMYVICETPLSSLSLQHHPHKVECRCVCVRVRVKIMCVYVDEQTVMVCECLYLCVKRMMCCFCVFVWEVKDLLE